METYTTPVVGPRPYRSDEAALFQGRESFIVQLGRYLELDRLVVLSSPSGYGKTSLLQAGFLPKLPDLRGWSGESTIINIRFTPYNEEDPVDPLRIFERTLLGPYPAYPELPLEETSCWLALKAYLEKGGKQQEHNRIVLVFDQFEELFTYPQSCVEDFFTQLGDLYKEEIPPYITRTLKRKKLLNPKSCGEEFEKMAEWISKPIQSYLLLSIEGSEVFQLEGLSPFIPEIMYRTHELPALKITEDNTRPNTKQAASPCRNLRLQLWWQNQEKISAAALPEELPRLKDYYRKFCKSLNNADKNLVFQLLEEDLLDKKGKLRRHVSEADLIDRYPAHIITGLQDVGLIHSFQHFRDAKSFEISHPCWVGVVWEAMLSRESDAVYGLALTRITRIAAVAIVAFSAFSLWAGATLFPNVACPVCQDCPEPGLSSNCPPTKTMFFQLENDTSLKVEYVQLEKQVSRGSLTPVSPGPNPDPDNSDPGCYVSCDSVRVLKEYIVELHETIRIQNEQLPCDDTPVDKEVSLQIPESIPIDVTNPVTGEITRIYYQPQVHVHTVKAGQTLSEIARLYGRSHNSSLKQLEEINHFGDPNKLKPGDKVVIPMGEETQAGVEGGINRGGSRAEARLRFHTVKGGESIFEIARKYAPSEAELGEMVRQIYSLNQLNQDSKISPGEQIQIPNL